MIQLFKNLGEWVEKDAYVPSPGDVIFYDWQDSGKGDNTGSADHVGIVETVANGKITVIEGNCANAVKRRTLNVNGRYIRGYGVPKYTANNTPAKAIISVEEAAKGVLAGKYGNGDTRKSAIEALGLNYAQVQTRVNQLVAAQNKPKAPQISVEDAAHGVLAGKYGNGDARKQAITALGLDYNTVQARVNEIVKEKKTTPKKSNVQVAKEVLAGKWGNGQARKKALTAAGYNYLEVQSEVNRLLR
jgi:hypothetical protein